jgi:hypothetical protein
MTTSKLHLLKAGAVGMDVEIELPRMFSAILPHFFNDWVDD